MANVTMDVKKTGDRKYMITGDVEGSFREISGCLAAMVYRIAVGIADEENADVNDVLERLLTEMLDRMKDGITINFMKAGGIDNAEE